MEEAYRIPMVTAATGSINFTGGGSAGKHVDTLGCSRDVLEAAV